jgi:hypothetical protein
MVRPANAICSVGAGAGFAGDRIDPALALVRSGLIDTMALECLAERTLVPAIKARADNPQAGFDPRWRRRLSPLLPLAAQHQCRVVSNLGAANPRAAVQAISGLCIELGLQQHRVAALVGDDVMGLQTHIQWAKPWQGQLIGAHAYLGSDLMAQALHQGAHVVVTGRVADSALFAAPARMQLLDQHDALAGALAVGHLLECGGQLTGGNFEPIGGANVPPPLSADQYARLGYPLAHVYADGSADITVVPGAPGIVDVLTCTLQLLYEVHDPAHYITPDLIVDFSQVRFEVTGPQSVRMSGARGKGVPPMLKVAGFVEQPGVLADLEIGFAGDGAMARAQCAADVLRRRLDALPAHDCQIDLVGIDSVLRGATRPSTAAPSELRVHISAACGDAATAQWVEDEVYALTLSGPAGGCSVRSEKRPRLAVVDGLIDRQLVPTELVWGQP